MPKPSTPTSRKTSPSAATAHHSSSSQEPFFEAIEILARKGNKYKVAWAGIDPDTGKQWQPSWEPRKNCSAALLATWTEKQKKAKAGSVNQSPAVAGKKRPTPISVTSTPVPASPPQSITRRRPSSRHSTATPQAAGSKPETQTSEYLPSQVLLLPDTSKSPTLRRPVSKKRKASFGVVVPVGATSKASKSSKSRSVSAVAEPKEETPKPVTPSAAIVPSSPEETPQETRVIKKRRLRRKVIEDSQPDPPFRSVPSSDPIEVSSTHSPPPVKSPSIEPTEEVIIVSDPPAPESPAPESPAKSSPRQSRSRQPTPRLLTPPRNRSLSPVTKVDSWFSIASEYDYGDAIAEHEGTIPKSDPLVIPSTSSMNPGGPPVGSVGPSFTPIQSLHRQMSQAQSNISLAGSPSPTIPPLTGRPVAQPVRRRQSRRSTSSSHQSFSSSLALRERLQSVSNSAVYKEIRSLATYAKKTPSLTSSATGSSILSGGTSASSLSTTDLSNLKLVHLGEGENILAVSGSALQSRMTRGVLINKQAQIQQFCLNPVESSEELVTTMKVLMSTCSAVATHPYLIIAPPLANADLDEAKEAEYLMSSSGKFAALGHILDALQGDKETKVGIMIQDVKGMDMLEGFLRGRNVRVKRTDGAGLREQQDVQSRGGPNVTLVLGGKAGARAIVNRVDVVIAMDLSFNPEDDQALRLRQHPTNLDELSPVIRLVTANSAEHVRLCLPAPYEIPSDRIVLQGLVSATTILRNFNGIAISNDPERFTQVAEYIRSRKQVDVFGIRDIEGYMAGHRGLAGLALKRTRSPTDEQGGDHKRVKVSKPTWQQPSMAMLQRENDQLHETLGGKQEINESLRSDLETLQKQFDVLSIQKTDLQTRLQQSLDENQSIKDQISQASNTDPVFLAGEITRLTKALESKTKDFDFLAGRYQDASVAANEATNEVTELKAQVEKLRTRLDTNVQQVTWEGEKKVLLERIQELEGKCKLLEARERKMQRNNGKAASA